jgi:uncharacterized protein (TIGR03435 family)
MMRFVLATVVGAGCALSQPATPTFEVASIKAVPSSPRGGGHDALFGDNIKATPGSLTMRSVTLKACIQWAYQLFEYQVTGPGAIDGDHYDVMGKAAGPANEPELRAMLQTLLADRFELKFHRQTKEMQAYVLSVGKGGPKVKESTTEGDGDIRPDQKTMTVTIQRMPMARIIDPLSRMFQMPVVDATGLKGRYDLSVNVAKYLPQAGEKTDPVSLIQTALQEELGLKLEAKKVPLDLLIVDHAAKAPVEN